MNVLDFGGVIGQLVRITRSDSKAMTIAEVEISGSLLGSPLPRIYPRRNAVEYENASGIWVKNGNLIASFDNNDFVTYKNLNFGPSGTTKSVRMSYSKGNQGGKIELRLGDLTGPIIGEFSTSFTGGWNSFKTVDIIIDDVEGINDLTIVGRDSWGVLDIEWFQLI